MPFRLPPPFDFSEFVIAAHSTPIILGVKCDGGHIAAGGECPLCLCRMHPA
jgi:hypothetical protein